MDMFVFDNVGTKKIKKENVKYRKRKAIDDDDVVEIVDEIPSEVDESECEDYDLDCGGLGPPTENSLRIIAECLQRENDKKVKKPSNTSSVDRFIASMGWSNPIHEKISTPHKNRFHNIALNLDTEIFKTNLEEEIKQTKNMGLEKNSTDLSKPNVKQLKKLNRIEKEKTKGSDWYDLPATEVDEHIENDLKILQMRSALDPKHFYKKNDLKVLPKYFQIGTVQHSPLDYYSERHIRKNKNKTMVDELMADAKFKQFTKRKYKEIVERKQNIGYFKALKRMKKLKKND